MILFVLLLLYAIVVRAFDCLYDFNFFLNLKKHTHDEKEHARVEKEHARVERETNSIIHLTTTIKY